MRFLNIIILVILMLATTVIGNSQSNEYKFEIGIQATALNRPGVVGGGLRLGYNINQYLGVEGEVNYFPEYGYSNTNQFQGQFGLKTGIRFNKIGIFGKVRPGFINSKQKGYDFSPPCPEACILISTVPVIQNTLPVTLIFPSPIFVPVKANETHFSLDIGVVVEFNPTKRFFVRADIGDTIAKRDNWHFTPITHNLQVTTGVGLRF